MTEKEHKPENLVNKRSREHTDESLPEFTWVITAETETVHYDKKYKSYLKQMYERRPAYTRSQALINIREERVPGTRDQ